MDAYFLLPELAALSPPVCWSLFWFTCFSARDISSLLPYPPSNTLSNLIHARAHSPILQEAYKIPETDSICSLPHSPQYCCFLLQLCLNTGMCLISLAEWSYEQRIVLAQLCRPDILKKVLLDLNWVRPSSDKIMAQS